MRQAISESHRQALIDTLQRAYLEIFPASSVESSLEHLPPQSLVAVTCSPTKGIDITLDIVERLVRRGFRIVPHIAAKSVRNDAHLHEIMKRLDDAQIDSVFVIGGDGSQPSGSYDSALQLLRAISERDHGFAQIGIAAHPEGHPHASDEQLLQQLQDKQEFATYLVTQMCFDAPVLGDWLKGIRDRGIALPAWIGLPGVANRAQLIATSLRIGVGDSLRLLRNRSDLVGRLLRSKAFRPDDLLFELAPYLADPSLNISGCHIYSFNQVASTQKWRNDFLTSLEKAS